MSAVRKTLAISGVTLLILFALIVLLAIGLMNGITNLMQEWGGPAVLHIDGESFTLGHLGFEHALVVAGALLLALLVVLVVVPVTLSVVALAVGVALVAAFGAPLLALGLVLLVLASPVLLIVGLVWLARRLLRNQTPPLPSTPPAAATTMGG